MNLKESFRYQKFLDNMMSNARARIMDKDNGLKVTRRHLRSKTNPDAVDVEEEMQRPVPFFCNDDVIVFMRWLIAEKQKLSVAIGKAKASAEFDIDAAVETNKYRQCLHSGIKNMLRYNATSATTRGQDFRFNLEGNQVPYYYDVEVVSEEAFDRKSAQNTMRATIMEADRVSAEIDAALINTQVDYQPVYDVNDTFEDAMSHFVEAIHRNDEQTQEEQEDS